MDTALRHGVDLEQLVRQELTDAGFLVESSLLTADGGLGVWHEPGRGVVVTWGTAGKMTANLVKYETIRMAVRLALRAVLAQAGHQVSDDLGGLELIVTS
jgi:hypothetical protein